MTRKATQPAAPTTVALSLLDSIDRDDLRTAMSASADDRFLQLSDALADPRYSRTAFIDILRKLKIPLTDLVDMWRKYNINLGLAQMYAQVPKVLADTARDASTTDRICSVCFGDRQIPDPRKGRDNQFVTCTTCNGDGTVRQVGDIASRKLVFETAELTGRSGPQVVIGSNNSTTVTNQTAISLSFRDTIEAANKVLDLGPARRDDLIETVAIEQVTDALQIEGGESKS